MNIQLEATKSPGNSGLIDPLMGESESMLELKRSAQVAALAQSTLMILGEKGSGKGTLARYVHDHSTRADHPFVPVDCSSLADELLERELFGQVRGAFPDALRDSLGIIRAANGGTLFLDEIAQLTYPLQSKLLRVLQDRAVVPIGGSTAYPVDIRVICATHCDLNALVQEGTFRQDLLSRLTALTLTPPALRDRAKDILPLAQHFLGVQSELYDEPRKRISHPVAEVMQAYAWPGNLRELANLIEQAHVLSSGETIELSDIPIRLQAAAPKPTRAVESFSLEDIERNAIASTLKRCNFNKAMASRILGINIQRLNRRIVRLGINA